MTTQSTHHICFICHRRSDGLAVGSPTKLKWFCADCGIPLALEASKMAKELDVFEQRACEQVAELCGTSQITLNKDELPAFVQWAVKEFGEAVRKEIEGGKPPF